MERATAVIVIAVVGALLLTAIVITAVAYHIIKRARRRALQNIGETECYHLLHMNFKGKVTLTFLCSHLCTKQRVWCTMTSLSAGDKQHLSSASPPSHELQRESNSYIFMQSPVHQAESMVYDDIIVCRRQATLEFCIDGKHTLLPSLNSILVCFQIMLHSTINIHTWTF